MRTECPISQSLPGTLIGSLAGGSPGAPLGHSSRFLSLRNAGFSRARSSREWEQGAIVVAPLVMIKVACSHR